MVQSGVNSDSTSTASAATSKGQNKFASVLSGTTCLVLSCLVWLACAVVHVHDLKGRVNSAASDAVMCICRLLSDSVSAV